jgi:hypothetical protein
MTRPHSTNELTEKAAPILTPIGQYQVTLPQLRIPAPAALPQTQAGEPAADGRPHIVISISYAVSSRSEPPPGATHPIRYIDLGNIILI